MQNPTLVIFLILVAALAVVTLREVFRDRPRSNFEPSEDELWGIHQHLANEAQPNTELTQRPPNIGGLGNPPYQGPNYLRNEEVADYLRPIAHFGRMSLREVNSGDLAWDYERGCVAGDGTIWLTPDTRAACGRVTVPAHEVPKALRFGWELVEGSQYQGYCEVERKQ